MVRCHEHNTEFEEVTTDFEAGGVIVRGVKGLRCPVGGEEIFTSEQASIIKAKLTAIMKPLRLRRKISTSGRRPALYIPEDVMRATQVKPGDDVDIYTEGRRIIIEPVSEPEN
ncbi:hypothetical protein A3K69_06925 [Candidatus Bathyarchaeota archaeon RBG_16_57_9]|jgi:hypothetical protein|nr:MAG: hypothetical protein A3K69_06925 [Candidatus Bathyarchaeota archaeon RBG_16_57_9]OGD54456.1 MAG: hypothetical protein A3K81_06275 [Candidatus Bathyarchaeota archaeon RBG_13_60_20]